MISCIKIFIKNFINKNTFKYISSCFSPPKTREIACVMQMSWTGFSFESVSSRRIYINIQNGGITKEADPMHRLLRDLICRDNVIPPKKDKTSWPNYHFSWLSLPFDSVLQLMSKNEGFISPGIRMAIVRCRE